MRKLTARTCRYVVFFYFNNFLLAAAEKIKKLFLVVLTFSKKSGRIAIHFKIFPIEIQKYIDIAQVVLFFLATDMSVGWWRLTLLV